MVQKRHSYMAPLSNNWGLWCMRARADLLGRQRITSDLGVSSANCECWHRTLILWYSLFHMTCYTVEYKNWSSGVQGFIPKVESENWDDMDLKLDSGARKPQRDQKLSRTQFWEFVVIKCDSFSLITVFNVTLWFYYLRTLQCLRS